MFRAINGLYKESKACIKINNIHTEFFNVEYGVKQWDPLSPLLFSLFINDLTNNIINKHCGVKAGIDNVGILLYADDIVLLSESPDKLQQLLNCLYKWCIKWKVYINANKSKIVHFRKVRTKKTYKMENEILIWSSNINI